MLMYYFSHIANNLNFKNKLERDVFDFLKTKERTVIDEKALIQFKEDVLDGIKMLNAHHARCKPIEADFWQPSLKGYADDNKDIHLQVGGFISFNLYRSNSNQ